MIVTRISKTAATGPLLVERMLKPEILFDYLLAVSTQLLIALAACPMYDTQYLLGMEKREKNGQKQNLKPENPKSHRSITTWILQSLFLPAQ